MQKRAICKTDGCKRKPDFEVCKETARRRRKENGTTRKRIKKRNKDINSEEPTVRKLIPAGTKGPTGSAHPPPAPTPAGQPHPAQLAAETRAELIPVLHPRQHPPLPHPTHATIPPGTRCGQLPSVAIRHGSSAVRSEGSGWNSEDTGSYGKQPRPHRGPKGAHQEKCGPPRGRWGRHHPGYPGRSRSRGAPPSRHFQNHRKMLPRSEQESGESGKVK